MPLPPHATVLDGPDVWVEVEAIDQLARVACAQGCVHAVGMPDLHPGPGSPIGAVLAFRDRVWPHLVGGDAGCGVRLMGLPRLKSRGDALERRARDAFGGPPDLGVDLAVCMAAVWAHGARGLADVPGMPESLAELAAGVARVDVPVGEVPDPVFAEQLGTVGGGNHFCELTRVAQVVDREAATEAGIGRFAALVHSGSRALGKHLATRWGAQSYGFPEARGWLRDLRGAVNFAAANRLVVAWRLLRACGAARQSRISGSLDIVHNTVEDMELEQGRLWVHRKGAAPAHAGQITVVLGSRGAPSWVMRGTGNPANLASVAHGAGRRWNRAEAISHIRAKYQRSELLRTATGGRVICDDREALQAEHPDCYKPIAPIIDALETAQAAHRIASLEPLLTIKR